MALFPFIDGQPLTAYGDELPPPLIRQIAGSFANLHCATTALEDLRIQPGAAGSNDAAETVVLAYPGSNAVNGAVVSLPSPFETSFSADFYRGINALAGIPSSTRPGLVCLRDLLLPRAQALLEWVNRVALLAQQAAARRPPLVLCHTDMGGNNVLVEKDGRLVVIDWDELTLAPAEHDLHEYRGYGPAVFARFLASYFQAGGARTLDPLQFEFYLLRRYLADLTDWMMRILHENTLPDQDANDLEGIRRYCLARLDRFEQDMMELRLALDQAQKASPGA